MQHGMWNLFTSIFGVSATITRNRFLGRQNIMSSPQDFDNLSFPLLVRGTSPRVDDKDDDTYLCRVCGKGDTLTFLTCELYVYVACMYKHTFDIDVPKYFSSVLMFFNAALKFLCMVSMSLCMLSFEWLGGTEIGSGEATAVGCIYLPAPEPICLTSNAVAFICLLAAAPSFICILGSATASMYLRITAPAPVFFCLMATDPTSICLLVSICASICLLVLGPTPICLPVTASVS